MNRSATPGRPKTVEDSDGRKANVGRPDGLGWALNQARDTAPRGATLGEISSVAWIAFQHSRRAVDVWPEILAESRDCPHCRGDLRRVGGGSLACGSCGEPYNVEREP